MVNGFQAALEPRQHIVAPHVIAVVVLIHLIFDQLLPGLVDLQVLLRLMDIVGLMRMALRTNFATTRQCCKLKKFNNYFQIISQPDRTKARSTVHHVHAGGASDGLDGAQGLQQLLQLDSDVPPSQRLPASVCPDLSIGYNRSWSGLENSSQSHLSNGQW